MPPIPICYRSMKTIGDVYSVRGKLRRTGMRYNGPLITENDVVYQVVDWLTQNGYRVKSYQLDDKPGIDIIACSLSGRSLKIEAKGDTSNFYQMGARLVGKPFAEGAASTYVARALKTVIALRRHGQSAIALPYTVRYKSHIREIEEALEALHIWMFWVGPKPDMTVTLIQY